MSANIRRALENMDEVDVDVVYVQPDDYSRYPAPKIMRISSVLELTWVVSKKLQEMDYSAYDAVILCGFELSYAVRKLVGYLPVILTLDTTPVLARALVAREQTSRSANIRGKVLSSIYKAIYGPVFRQLSAYFPLTPWCGRSLVEDFHVPAERIVPCYTSLDLDKWRPKEACTPVEEPLRLLFVGNDFERKGGEELLRLYRDVLSMRCVLTIVSSDPSLDGREFPAGVERLKNIPHEEMYAHFREADVFVFPTRRDQLALVLAEAMACGLAVVARDVGGIQDVLRDGWNGYLMKYDTPMSKWGERILALARDRNMVCKMGRRSRERARTLFAREIYDGKIQETVRAILVGEKFHGGM